MLGSADARDDRTKAAETLLGRDGQDRPGSSQTATPPTVLPQVAAAWGSRIGRNAVILGTLLVAAIFGAAGLLVALQRVSDLAESRRTTDNLAQILAEQTARTLQPVDLTLREVVGRLTASGITTQGAAGAWRSKATFDLLTDRLKGLPQADVLSIASADGHVVNFSRRFPAPRMDVSGRDFFRYLSTHDDHALFISAPACLYLTGKWTVFLARRINDADGAFAGVVTAAVTLSYFEDFYRAVTPASDAVTLLRRDGLILATYPRGGQPVGSRIPAESPWYRAAAAAGGSYRSPDPSGGSLHLVSARSLRGFPLVLDVGTTEAAALSGWFWQTLWILAGASLAAACAIFLMRLFARQYSRLAEQNAALETSRLRFDAVLDNVSQGVTFFDRDRKLVLCNRRFAEMYKLTPAQSAPGTSLSDIVKYRQAVGTFLEMAPTAYVTRAQSLVDAADDFELINELSDGRSILLHSRPMALGGGWVSTHEDITQRRGSERALAFMARHDALTELPNRTLFQERLTQAIVLAQRGGQCALLCLDLDRFKVINDTLGHPVGDALLRAVAGRLAGTLRTDDTVARLGGDEFAIIQTGLKSADDPAHLAERVVAALGEPYDIEGHRVIAGVSIGIAIAPGDGATSDVLLKNADIALYLAKTEGRGTWRFFKPEIDAYLHRRSAVELELREALPAEHFELHYQPVLDLETRRVTGFEALIRWNHPVRGRISPSEFIPIAEETGQIVPIGAWALRTACLEAARWPPEIEIAVNLSPVQFKRGQVLSMVQDALAASGLDPARLELEITESVLLENSGDRLALLHQLRALGIRIALDDFGTGYSSLSYLRSFPFNKIKIDQSFIREIDTDRQSAAIVGAVVGLGRSLGMTTVAEGVETPRQLATVRDHGCTKVQGYLFSRPAPAAEVPDMVRLLWVPERDELARASHGGVISIPLYNVLRPMPKGAGAIALSG